MIRLEMLISLKQIHVATQLRMMSITESCDQLTPITTVMVVVPVAAVNCSRTYSRGGLYCK